MAKRVVVGQMSMRVRVEPAPARAGVATQLPDDWAFRLRKNGFDEVETALLRELLTGPCQRDRRTRAA